MGISLSQLSGTQVSSRKGKNYSFLVFKIRTSILTFPLFHFTQLLFKNHFISLPLLSYFLLLLPTNRFYFHLLHSSNFCLVSFKLAFQ
jgi:hypothetical protein